MNEWQAVAALQRPAGTATVACATARGRDNDEPHWCVVSVRAAGHTAARDARYGGPGDPSGVTSGVTPDVGWGGEVALGSGCDVWVGGSSVKGGIGVGVSSVGMLVGVTMGAMVGGIVAVEGTAVGGGTVGVAGGDVEVTIGVGVNVIVTTGVSAGDGVAVSIVGDGLTARVDTAVGQRSIGRSTDVGAAAVGSGVGDDSASVGGGATTGDDGSAGTGSLTTYINRPAA